MDCIKLVAKPALPAVWMGCAFCAGLGLAGVVLAALGAGEEGTRVALSATARLSFLLFWPAYVGGALTTLFGPAFEGLKQRGRDFGLAFASAHLVHIALVTWLVHIGAAPSVRTFVFFGIGVMWTYLLALFSIARLQRNLGSTGWWLMRIGLNYIAFAFAVDFLRVSPVGTSNYLLGYLPFSVLSVVGPTLCLIAYTRRTVHVWRFRFDS